MDWTEIDTDSGKGYTYTIDMPIDGMTVFVLIPSQEDSTKYIYHARQATLDGEGTEFFSRLIDKQDLSLIKKNAMSAIINFFYSQSLLLKPEELGVNLQ